MYIRVYVGDTVDDRFNDSTDHPPCETRSSRQEGYARQPLAESIRRTEAFPVGPSVCSDVPGWVVGEELLSREEDARKRKKREKVCEARARDSAVLGAALSVPRLCRLYLPILWFYAMAWVVPVSRHLVHAITAC